MTNFRRKTWVRPLQLLLSTAFAFGLGVFCAPAIRRIYTPPCALLNSDPFGVDTLESPQLQLQQPPQRTQPQPQHLRGVLVAGRPSGEASASASSSGVAEGISGSGAEPCQAPSCKGQPADAFCYPPLRLEPHTSVLGHGDVCRAPGGEWECPICCRGLAGPPYCGDASDTASPCRVDACPAAAGGPPQIWTFYAEIKGEAATSGKLLALWKEAWSKAGWHPRVMTLADVARHPQYESVLAAVKQIPLGVNSNYDLNCYLRHFGMAAVGGGWMADFDVLPLTEPRAGGLPGGGRFTVHEPGVPSLISASAEEWDRVALRLVEEGGRHPESYLFSDMHALQALQDKGVYDVKDKVAGLDKEHGLTFLRPGACAKSEGLLAAHFSHAATHVLSGNPRADRASVAVEALERWVRTCRLRPPFGLNASSILSEGSPPR